MYGLHVGSEADYLRDFYIKDNMPNVVQED